MSSLGLARRRWDIVVVGGGITGAGVFREAARAGLRTLLVEQDDFASGTSSRSANLVHGGLRYLASGEFGLVRRATRSRDEMLRHAPGLVHPLRFVLSVDPGDRKACWKIRSALWTYDVLSGDRPRRHSWRPFPEVHSGMFDRSARMVRFAYQDAITDDVRVVLRVIREGCAFGGIALSYSPVRRVTQVHGGESAIVHIQRAGGSSHVQARVVVVATGPSARGPCTSVEGCPPMRRIRGTHIVLGRSLVPLRCAVAGYHPTSRRAIYAVPWQGVVLVGTTHEEEPPSERPPRASAGEVRYLLAGLRGLLPGTLIGLDDIQAVYAGVRSIADTETGDPARASRNHAILQSGAVISVRGGKLTTFHDASLRAMELVARRIGVRGPRRRPKVFDRPLEDAPVPGVSAAAAQRLAAYYGRGVIEALNRGPSGDRNPLPGLAVLRGELRWILRNERVEHLDDLMLRRLRVGITLPNGGASLLGEMGPFIRSGLGWSRSRWIEEVHRYRRIWKRDHAPPDGRARRPSGRETSARLVGTA